MTNSGLNNPKQHTKTKRKGENFEDVATRTAVVIAPHTTSSSSSWEATKAKLAAYGEQLRCQDPAEDPVSLRFQDCWEEENNLEAHEAKVKEDAASILGKLKTKIEIASIRCKEASDELYQLAQALQRDQQIEEDLYQDLNGINDEVEKFKREIRECEEVANQECERIDWLEEERKKRVPRMKQQISLYARCSGIKWDFHQEQLLAGHVAIYAKEVVRPFCIDPENASRFEIANKLWGVMEADEQSDL